MVKKVTVRWSEGIWNAVMKRPKVEGGDKWKMKIFVGMCVLPSIYSHAVCMWVTVQYVVLLLFDFCILLFVMFFIIRFMFVFLFCMFFFLFDMFCVFVLSCVLFLLMYIVVFFSICMQAYWQLPLAGNPTAVNRYHIISYQSWYRCCSK